MSDERKVDPATVVFQHLRRVGDRNYGYGWQEMVNRRLDRATGYITRDMSKRTMRLTTLLDALDALGVAPQLFFEEAFESNSSYKQTPDLSESAPHEPRLGRILPKLVFDQATASPGAESPILAGILESKKTDPRNALEMALSALLLVANQGIPKSLTFPLLLETGATLVRLDRLHNARACYTFCYRMAATCNSEYFKAQVLLRLPTLDFRETAKADKALRSANCAYLAFTDLGDQRGIGQSLVIRSFYLNNLGLADSALNSLSLALAFLEEDDPYVTSIHQTFAVIYKQKGHLREATKHLHLAEQKALAAPYDQGMINWVRAEIAALRGDSTQACRFFESSLDLLLPIAPVMAALVALDYARLLLSSGDTQLALKMTRFLARLVEPLSAYPQVQGIVLNFLNITHSSSRALTIQILEQTSSDIRNKGGTYQGTLE